MSADLLDDDDLFAVRPAPATPTPPTAAPVAPALAKRRFRWIDNPGRQPEETKGKRVVVELASGRICGVEPVTTVTPAGWAADTTRWTLGVDEWDVRRFRVL